MQLNDNANRARVARRLRRFPTGHLTSVAFRTLGHLTPTLHYDQSLLDIRAGAPQPQTAQRNLRAISIHYCLPFTGACILHAAKVRAPIALARAAIHPPLTAPAAGTE